MGRSPVELRVGGTGAGVFVGCGAGIGIVTPVSLHSIPVLGQLASSLAASLGSLNAATGGLATAARGRVRGLGVRGLDLGFGCGVMLGYGWGAGLMLSPTAQQSVAHGLRDAGQRLLARLPPPLQAALQQQRQRHAAAGSGEPPLGLHSSSAIAGGPPDSAAPPQFDLSPNVDGLAMATEARGLDGGSTPPADQRPQQLQQRQPQQPALDNAADVAQLAKLALHQQNQLSELQQQVAALQAAVCRLDPAAPACKHAQ